MAFLYQDSSSRRDARYVDGGRDLHNTSYPAAIARQERSRNGHYQVLDHNLLPRLLPVLVSSSPIELRFHRRDLFSCKDITASTVKTELGQQSSKASSIFGPDSVLYPNATERWNTRIITPKA